METMIGLVILIFGCIIGSFINVCIYRIPKGVSIVRPGSACPSCGNPIKWYDNIPLLSYVLLRGKCRHCKSAISVRYPVVEILTAFYFLLLYFKFGFSIEMPIHMLFGGILIIVSFIDLELQIIPDILSLGGLAAGFLLSFARPGFSFIDSLYGIFLGGGILFAIAGGYKLVTKREGMGGGDIKLLAMIGAFCGIKGVVFSLMSGSLIGTLVGIPLMLIKRQGSTYAIPFGPFLSLGALIYVFAGEIIIYGFFNFLSIR
jgi:leader peptidase (prepilin peptidase) / N-methyltransferase